MSAKTQFDTRSTTVLSQTSYRYQGVLPGVMTKMCFLTHHCFERHEVQIQCTQAHTDMSIT